MDLSFAVNQIKAKMALDMCHKRAADLRKINPGKEFPDPTAEDVKAQYVTLAGLLASEEAVVEMEERARHNDFVKKSGAAEKLKSIVKRPKSKE